MVTRGPNDGGAAGVGTECVFTLPDLGEGLVSGEIIEWLVAVDDAVRVDQPVVVVETEKTSLELPSPYQGRVAQVHGAVGDIVPVGAPLLTVHNAVEGGAPAGMGAHLVGQRRHPDPAAGQAGSGLVRRLPPKPDGARVLSSPAVRRLARQLDVDLRQVTGTGTGGSIRPDDVHAASRRSPGKAGT